MNHTFRLLLIVFLINVIFLSVTTSQKEDNIWLLGYSGERDLRDSSFGGTNFDFRFKPREISYIQRKNHFWHTNASISDSNGNLLFFTNGIYIGNKNYEIMDNGHDINEWSTLGYTQYQGALILPFPSNPNLFYCFQGEDLRLKVNGKFEWVGANFKYSIVDMAKNKGLGKVTEKNTIINKAYFNAGFIMACQHANGKDWWIVIPRLNSEIVDIYLLDSQGVNLEHSIEFKKPIINGWGAAKFTPDGTKYINIKGVKIYDGYHIDIFDFDRCTGELSNHIYFYDDPILDTTYHESLAISPNSRYLYVSNTWHVLQYDLQAEDIQASRITVAEWDGFVDFGATVFDKMQLAPDGKIYISPPGSSHYMHIIHAPDSAGLACRVEQHAIKLPAWNNGTIPNFPHFRMGRLKGSPCDTLTSILDLTPPQEQAFLNLYPNPVQSELSIGWKDGFNFVDDMSIHFYNTLGDEVKVAPILNKNMTIDVAHFTKGLYIYTVVREGHIMQKGKIVVE